MMSEAEKISMTARMSGRSDSSDHMAILDYLSIAGQEIMERCYPFGYTEEDSVPNRYALLQCKIAAYLLNKEGAEGQTAHAENGISRSYESGGVPESLLRQITPRGVVY